jgi:hypothetical protein
LKLAIAFFNILIVKDIASQPSKFDDFGYAIGNTLIPCSFIDGFNGTVNPVLFNIPSLS